MGIKKFFNQQQKELIVQAIKDAEKMTSGEIRVHLESRCRGDIRKQTIKWFNKLKMDRTELHNGILIYLAVQDRQFAIYGDEGINKVVPDNFWVDVKEQMQAMFSNGKFTEGLILGIHRVGEKLKEFFPYQQGDVNELSDEISTG